MNHEGTKTRSLRVAPAFDEGTEELAREIVDSSYTVHRALGPGLLESVYEACLRRELETRGIQSAAQIAIPLEYKEMRLDCGFRLDLIVDERIIVEVKAIEKLLPVHDAQLLTYLKLARKLLGFLISTSSPSKKGFAALRFEMPFVPSCLRGSSIPSFS